MNIKDLEKCFESAKAEYRHFVGVQVEMQGFPKPEIIVNEYDNFDSKLEYYKKAYNEDLTLKTFSGIKIIGFASGSNFRALQDKLDV